MRFKHDIGNCKVNVLPIIAREMAVMKNLRTYTQRIAINSHHNYNTFTFFSNNAILAFLVIKTQNSVETAFQE